LDRDPIVIPWAPQVRDDCSLALARGLDRVVGYALPLAWDWRIGGWRSVPWPFETMLLAPGSSPMGLRLPIARLPRSTLVEQEEEEIVAEPAAWHRRHAEHHPVRSAVTALHTAAPAEVR